MQVGMCAHSSPIFTDNHALINLKKCKQVKPLPYHMQYVVILTSVNNVKFIVLEYYN